MYLENGHALKLVVLGYYACCDIFKETTIPIIKEIFSKVIQLNGRVHLRNFIGICKEVRTKLGHKVIQFWSYCH